MSDFLEVIGAKTHNLKNISVKIPKNKITVITGLSGSGKSSLAFNTIYSVGNQKYMESLSSYARMFIGGMKEEAEVDEIKGLSPAISIDQKTISQNPRSTVGTITEIYDYYKLFYLNIGEVYCKNGHGKIKKDSFEDVLKTIKSYEIGTKFIIKVKTKEKFTDIQSFKNHILGLGFLRISYENKFFTINDEIPLEIITSGKVFIVVDRLTVSDYEKEENFNRISDSLDLAFKSGKGIIEIDFMLNENHPVSERFSEVFSCSECGYIPAELNISSFSFNSPHGFCENCHGLGLEYTFLPENIINENLTLEEGAITAPGFGNFFLSLAKALSKKHKFPLNIPFKDLDEKTKNLILFGDNKRYEVSHKNANGKTFDYETTNEGIINTLKRRFMEGSSSKTEDGYMNSMVTEIPCETCKGHRLKQESLLVKIDEKNIGELSDLSVEKALEFFKNLKLSENQNIMLKNVLKNTLERLEFLEGVGLSYITISRKANTISGGEGQRIRLATQIGVKLEGIIYVLDEPSIGLHPRDNDMLINNLKNLRDIGNTLIIVEHDEDIMRESDYIIDIGPGAGVNGGQIIAEGTFSDIIKDKNSVTGKYLSGEKQIIVERPKRIQKEFLEVFGAKQNNLKNISIKIPAENFTVVTGVSGGGKSSLINDILANYLSNELNRSRKQVGDFEKITGVENFDKTLIIDQSPIGKTPRSNPATYTGLFTLIRDVFASSYEATVRGYAAGKFSFNTKDGRCEECEGDGLKKIEMHFLPPVYIECEKCKGTRYNPETLAVKFKGKNIADVLALSVDEGAEFFKNHPRIMKILNVLQEIGLGYIKLGQSSTTLSGGEAQRIKLGTELSKRSTSKTIYILDEPTTGLHFQDVDKLLNILHNLVNKGNTVVVIEHNMNVILNADYLIDIGPEGGDKGGNLVYQGDLKGIVKVEESYTGKSILKYLKSFGKDLEYFMK